MSNKEKVIMKYQITSVNWGNSKGLIEHYPCLTNFGFEIDHKIVPKDVYIRDENGDRIKYEEGERVETTCYVNINDLEELQKLSKAVKNPLVMSEDKEPVIEICD